MFCTECAAPNPVPAARCGRCGDRLGTELGFEPDASALRLIAVRDPQRQSLTSRRRWSQLGALAVILLMAGVLLGFRRSEDTHLAEWYARAEAAVATGDFSAALDAFAAASGYGDADARRTSLVSTLDAAHAAYLDAVNALGDGRYDDAIRRLEPVVRQLPSYREAVDLLGEARQDRRTDLLRQADAAEQDRDWLGAARALAVLAGDDPADAALQRRLAELRQQHAPLVFARDHALWLTGPDGGDDRLLTSAVTVARPVWSPDQSQIAFVSGNPNDSRVAASIFVVNADGTGLRRVAHAVHPNAVLVWSPDGSRIAYTSVASWNLRREQGLLTVHVVDAATGHDTDVTSSSGRQATTPTWSPTGNRLAFVSRALPTTPSQPSADGPADVFVLDLRTGEFANLTQGRVPGVVRVLWSPTRDRLLLYSRNWTVTGGSAASGTALYLLDPNRGGLTIVERQIDAASSGWSPAWAPDGERFAYVDDDSTVILRDAEGGTTRVDTGIFLSGALTWSPDGREIVAVSGDPGIPSVTISLDQPGAPTLTDLPLQYDTDWPTGTPEWSPAMSRLSPEPATIAGTALDGAGSSD